MLKVRVIGDGFVARRFLAILKVHGVERCPAFGIAHLTVSFTLGGEVITARHDEPLDRAGEAACGWLIRIAEALNGLEKEKEKPCRSSA